MNFEQFLKKGIVILSLIACEVPLTMECFLHQ